MSEAGDTKVCPHCAEAIKAAAKVCPHCRFSQRRISLYNPQFVVLVFTLVYSAIIACFGIAWERSFDSKEDFADHRDDLSITRYSFGTRLAGSNLLVGVYGMLTNHGTVSWKEISVEARFVDKSGRLVDVIGASAQNFDGPVVLPHGEAAFRVEAKAARPAGDYSDCKPTVRFATDARSIF